MGSLSTARFSGWESDILEFAGSIWSVYWGYRGNGKENGSYYLGFRVWG